MRRLSAFRGFSIGVRDELRAFPRGESQVLVVETLLELEDGLGEPFHVDDRVAPGEGTLGPTPSLTSGTRVLAVSEFWEAGVLEPIDEEECWGRLAQHAVGRLAVAVGSQPDIFPVNYIVEDRQIVVRTAEGTKLAAALMGQLVAFEIDEIDDDAREGWSVVVHGTTSESHSLPSVLHDEELELEPWAKGTKNRFIRITPTRVTGRVLYHPTSEAGE